jgi:hypothetical protein
VFTQIAKRSCLAVHIKNIGALKTWKIHVFPQQLKDAFYKHMILKPNSVFAQQTSVTKIDLMKQ